MVAALIAAAVVVTLLALRLARRNDLRWALHSRPRAAARWAEILTSTTKEPLP